MLYKQNLHQHSSFDDGKDTPEEVVLAAIEKGFDSIGFSGHSYMHWVDGISMTLEGTEQYKKEIARLKEKYSDKIKVFCGLEVEMLSEVELSGYDYLIGSVHYLKMDDEIVGIDRSKEVVQGVIDSYFGGDGLKCAGKYYEQMAELYKYGDFDIIGHFDLIAKHNETANFFDEQSKEYQSLALGAIEALRGKIPFFEVNTGGISRGYRKNPYPNEFIVKVFRDMGFGAVISSDCHDKNYLDIAFKESEELLKSCGYNEIYVLTENGFDPTKI
ncbi:MAG: histidinol-phosphatase [Oscillospiraceae bacterium]|nr:histidinol-phosphatase [Oscillospiraceae bacterium]